MLVIVIWSDTVFIEERGMGVISRLPARLWHHDIGQFAICFFASYQDKRTVIRKGAPGKLSSDGPGCQLNETVETGW